MGYEKSRGKARHFRLPDDEVINSANEDLPE